MLKKSLAWVLTLALLLSTVSGLALFSFADGEAVFAYASFVSGQALYSGHGTAGLYTAQVVSTEMSAITNNEADRYAAYMGHQNDQIGLKISASNDWTSNVTIEVKFWGNPENQTDTRLGMNYSTDAGGMTDYSTVQMTGKNGEEIVTVNSAPTKADVAACEGEVTYTDDGWGIYTLTVTNAKFSTGGEVNFVKWSHDNGDNTNDGWYIESILVYDTDRDRPTADDLYIREDTVGYIDFTDDEVEKELLDYTGGEIVDLQDMKALKINDSFKVTAKEDRQPAVKVDDAKVSVLLEAYAKSNVEGYPSETWCVMREDLTKPETTEFSISTLFGFAEDAEVYIRKVVICRTELVSINTYDNAFVNVENPVAIYNDFQRVVTEEYNMTYTFSNEGDDKNTQMVTMVDGKTALVATGGYHVFNVDDAFTKNGQADVTDLSIEVTYLDKSKGDLNLNYNKVIPDNYDELEYDDKIPYDFASAKIATLEDSGEWKTATVYLSDAQFRNAGAGDFRINVIDFSAIASVKVNIGADKAALNTWINKPVNTAAYTADSVKAYNAAKTAAQTVASDVYATKAQVEKAVKDMSDAYEALEPTSDNRFTLINASWNIDETQGAIDVLDGWYVWKFTPNTASVFMGIGDPDGILKDSKSVTYEYEIMMDTTSGNDRCFLGYGDDLAWHGVDEGGPLFDEDGYLLVEQDGVGNGFAAGGQWGKTPAVGEWGTISITNDHYDPTRTSNVISGAITTLGSWMTDGGTLYVRSVKVYDTNDPTKMIALMFKEDVAELIPSPGADAVVVADKDGFQTYMIPGQGWLALDINSESLINQGTVVEGADNIAIELEYWLDEWETGADTANELLMIKHYNPDGTGQNGNKNDVCEHQFNSSSEELQTRGQWVKATFILDDADFGAKNSSGKSVLNITYGNGSNIYIRGIKLYEIDEEGEMASSKPASWGSMLIKEDEVVFDHPTYDWNVDKGYQLKVNFDEGKIPTTFDVMEGYKAAIINDDMLYVNVDDEAIPETQKFIRIDITHQNGASMHVEYNAVLPDGTDVSAEPNLSYYNFRSSNGIHEIVNGENVGQTSIEYSNPLGVIRSVTDEHIDWMTTSIYLTDAQFRNACNGSDFRVRVFGGAVITKIEVFAISESDIPTVGDASKLQDLYDQLAEEYDGDFDDSDLEDAFYEAEDFLKFQYRASQADIDAAVAALQKAIDASAKTAGDVDGDGDITSTDARLTLQYYAEKITADDLDTSVADVDNDGDITSTDARLILQLYAGKIDAFPQA